MLKEGFSMRARTSFSCSCCSGAVCAITESTLCATLREDAGGKGGFSGIRISATAKRMAYSLGESASNGSEGGARRVPWRLNEIREVERTVPAPRV